MEKMPMWCPPTPPQDENDVYRDYALSFLYETTDIIPETQLPPVYVKKELKRNRNEAGFFSDGRRPVKIRKEETYYPPRSLFDKPSPALAKIRRELKIQRYRGNFKPMIQVPGLKQQLPMKPLVDPEGMLEWFIYEDMAILNVIQNLQGLPLNLMLLSPGQTPNWDLVADIVNQTSRTYRSPKQCRYRYEAVIVPREEGKLMESPKKQKKNKNPLKIPSPLKGVRSLRTSQLYHSDNNGSFTKFIRLKFDNIKTAYLKKAPQLKQLLVNPSLKNPKHAAVLSEFGIGNYESPMSPLDLTLRRVERINKDKQKASVQVTEQGVPQQAQPQLQLATIQGGQSNAPQATAIVVQASVAGTPLLVQSSPIQVTRHTSGVLPQQSQHLVKALVTSSGNVQHIVNVSQASQSQIQQLANQQSQGQPTSVSVVLTGTTVSSLQQQSQLVSIQTPNIVSSSGNVSQTGSIVQTMTSQALPQVVSVSQLQNVGTVITTSALGSNVATMSPSIRAQRIVGPGGITEVVLNRSQSPTVVSVSGLGQGLTQNQLQATQLRFQVSSGQQISGVVTKGISVGQGIGKPSNTPQIQIIRPQLRQQFKILQPTLGQATGTVVQSAGGQATLVSPGTLIQGGLVQQGNSLQTLQVQQSTGQKVQLVSAANTVTVTNPIVGQTNVVGSVATVQVAPGQTRTQFIKHIGPNKQAPRQLNNSESVQALIKHQILNQQKPQVIPQSQIQFAPGMPGTSGQQQIATLVKTSSGNLTTLQQMKSGQIKATMANQSQVRQIQLQQQQPYAIQNRKGGKMTQFAQVAGKTGMQTQLIVQNPKTLTGTVTMQQIQHVIRHAPPGTITTGQIVLGKPGRVIPVSVASQSNQRPIQVVTASAAQALAAGNLRTHVVGTQNTSGGTIKVAASAAQVHQQQALLTAFQNQRQNSNQQLRLQTTSSPIVAVTVQQQPSVQVAVPSVQQNNSSDTIQTVQNQKSQNQ